MGRGKEHFYCDDCNCIHTGGCGLNPVDFLDPEPIDYYEGLWQTVWEEGNNYDEDANRAADWDREKTVFLALSPADQVEEVKRVEAAVLSLTEPNCQRDGCPEEHIQRCRGCRSILFGNIERCPFCFRLDPVASHYPNHHANHKEPCGADCVPF